MKARGKISAIVLVVCALFIATHSKAQQDPMYSMYMLDKMLINPGYTGSGSWMVGTLKHRQQFSGIEGNPTTQTFNFHTPIGKRFVGLGFKVVNDKIAIMRNLNASLYYSYHLNFAGGKLSMGLETGFYSRSIDYGDLILTTLGDNALPTTTTRAVVPDASWGMYFQKKDFFLGFSQNHIIKANFEDQAVGDSQSRLYAHSNLMAGTVFDLSGKFAIEPSFLLKSVSGAPLQLDLNATLYYDDMIGLGGQFRTGDAFVMLFKVNLKESLRVAYAYDMTISGLSPYAGATHEIILSYGINLPPPASIKEVHPRYYF